MKPLHTVSFEDIKPGEVFYHCYGHRQDGERILAPITTLFVKSEPWKHPVPGLGYFIDVEEHGRKEQRSLADMNVQLVGDELQYNNNYLFYTKEDAIAYDLDPELSNHYIVKGKPTPKNSIEFEAIRLVRKLFEEKWHVYTNEPGWKNIKKFEDSKCLFNDFKTLSSQVFKDILTEMENEFKTKSE